MPLPVTLFSVGFVHVDVRGGVVRRERGTVGVVDVGEPATRIGGEVVAGRRPAGIGRFFREDAIGPLVGLLSPTGTRATRDQQQGQDQPRDGAIRRADHVVASTKREEPGEDHGTSESQDQGGGALPAGRRPRCAPQRITIPRSDLIRRPYNRRSTKTRYQRYGRYRHAPVRGFGRDAVIRANFSKVDLTRSNGDLSFVCRRESTRRSKRTTQAAVAMRHTEKIARRDKGKLGASRGPCHVGYFRSLVVLWDLPVRSAVNGFPARVWAAPVASFRFV